MSTQPQFSSDSLNCRGQQAFDTSPVLPVRSPWKSTWQHLRWLISFQSPSLSPKRNNHRHTRACKVCSQQHQSQ